MATMQTPTMYHLTLNHVKKRDQLFKVMKKLKTLQNSETVSKVVVLTDKKMTADHLSVLLNLKGIKAATITNYKSSQEIRATSTSFCQGNINVLVTNKMNFRINLDCVHHLINYDMFVPNILY